MAEHQSSPGAFSAISESPLVATPSTSGGNPERKKFRSGYQREKFRRQKLYAELDDLRLENARLQQDLSDLETMFDELKRLNAELAADLKQARQRVPVPSFAGLMGHR
jgi:septal ring factor EnvC (AmiA/AmiB activator)